MQPYFALGLEALREQGRAGDREDTPESYGRVRKGVEMPVLRQAVHAKDKRCKGYEENCQIQDLKERLSFYLFFLYILCTCTQLKKNDIFVINIIIYYFWCRVRNTVTSYCFLFFFLLLYFFFFFPFFISS